MKKSILNENNKLATKKDLSNVERVLRQEMQEMKQELRGEMQNMELRIRKDIKDIEANVVDMMEDRIMTVLDSILKQLEDLRMETISHTASYERLEEKVDSHEERIVKLEHVR